MLQRFIKVVGFLDDWNQSIEMRKEPYPGYSIPECVQKYLEGEKKVGNSR